MTTSAMQNAAKALRETADRIECLDFEGEFPINDELVRLIFSGEVIVFDLNHRLKPEHLSQA